MTNEEIERELGHLATKADLADEIGKVRTEIADFRGETRTALAELRAEIHKEMSALTWKLIGVILPIYALIVALAIAVFPHLK